VASRADQEREKLINAIIFFVKSTDYCYSLKLFKLLFFLDFEIFRQTGKSTTGLTYFALQRGPVPLKLYNELSDPGADLKSAVLIRMREEIDFRQVSFHAKHAYDDGCFTKRELKVMEELTFLFKDARSDSMTDVSHGRDGKWRAAAGAWRQVYEVEKRPNGEISYLLGLDAKPDSITKEQAEAIADEMKEAEALFK
jgi:hypothetical protein